MQDTNPFDNQDVQEQQNNQNFQNPQNDSAQQDQQFYQNLQNDAAQQNQQLYQNQLNDAAQQTAPVGAKKSPAGILILLGIVLVAVIAYFAVQFANKDKPGVTIPEQDRLELISPNLYGKWNRTEGDFTYQIYFKTTKELVFTRFDKDGKETAKSDTGSYEIKDGVLHLQMTSGETAYDEQCNAIVSEKNLIITSAAEGTGIFNGEYTVVPLSDTELSDGTEQQEQTESTQNEPSQGDPIQNGTAESTATESAANTEGSDPPQGGNSGDVDKTIYNHLPPKISQYLSMTGAELINLSTTTPEPKGKGGFELTVYGEKIIIYGNYDTKFYFDRPNDKPTVIVITVDQLLTYPETSTNKEITGKDVYSYNELKEIYGDKLSCEYHPYEVLNDGYEVPEYYDIKVIIDGHIIGLSDHYEAIDFPASADIPIKYCTLLPRQSNYEHESSASVDKSVYEHLPKTVLQYLSMTGAELINLSTTGSVRKDESYGGCELTIDGEKIAFFGQYEIGYDEYGNLRFGHYVYEDFVHDNKLTPTHLLIPINLLLTYPNELYQGQGVIGKRIYTYDELKEIYGDKLTCEYDDVSAKYYIMVNVDGYYIQFSCDDEWPYVVDSLSMPITHCLIFKHLY